MLTWVWTRTSDNSASYMYGRTELGFEFGGGDQLGDEIPARMILRRESTYGRV